MTGFTHDPEPGRRVRELVRRLAVEVFGAGAPAVLGSVKSMIGHAMPAAGIAGFVKAALAVHNGVLLPTLHCDDPHPGLAQTRFRPIDAALPWPTEPGGVRRAAGKLASSEDRDSLTPGDRHRHGRSRALQRVHRRAE